MAIPQTHYRFDFTDRCYKSLTEEASQAIRSHPDKPFKPMDDITEEYTVNHLRYPIPASTARDARMREQFIQKLRSDVLKNEQTYLIDKDHDTAKMVGYGEKPISTHGTSVPGRLIFTAQIAGCSGVLLEGKKGTLQRSDWKTKFRISHVLHFNKAEFSAIRNQNSKMQNDNFETEVSIFGGNDDSSTDSRRIRRMFRTTEPKAIPIKSDEFFENRPEDDELELFGGAIDELDKTVCPVKKIATYELVEE